MSIFVMSLVWKRYPMGGGDMLLALAMADHASDDGTKVYPSIKHLAQKTRQSERTVQYQLRRMEELRWLILVNAGNGGRNMCREYCINPDWINGAELASINKSPVKDPENHNGAKTAPLENGANDDVKGATDGIKGAIDDVKGATVTAPASNHQEPSETVIKPSTATPAPQAKKKPGPAAPVMVLPEWISEATWNDWVEHRVSVKAPLTQRAAELCIGKLEKLRVAGHDPKAVIEQSVLSGKWTDLYPVKADLPQPGGGAAARAPKFDPTAYANKTGNPHAPTHSPTRAQCGDIIDVESKPVKPLGD